MACTACGSILNGIYKHAPMTMEQLNESRNRDREIVILTDSETSLFGTTTPPSVEYILDALHDDPVTEPLRFIPAFEMTTNSSDEDFRYLVTWEALYAIQHSLGLRYLVDGGIEDNGDNLERLGSLRSFDGTSFNNRGDIDRGSITTIGEEGLFSVSLGINSIVTGDYSTIAGGGAPASAGVGNGSRATKGNIITSLGSFIGAGDNNAIIRIDSTYIASKSFIAAGGGNTIYGSDFGFIHGTNNTISYVNVGTIEDFDPSRGSHHSTILNGDSNYIDARGFNTILGGTLNRIEKLYQDQQTGSVSDWVNGHNIILNGSGNEIYRGFGVINSGSSNKVQNSAFTSIFGGTGNRTSNARHSVMINSNTSQILGGSPTSDFGSFKFDNASIFMSSQSAIIGSWLNESIIANTMNMLFGAERSAILNSLNSSIYNSCGSRIYGSQKSNIIGSSNSKIISLEPTNIFNNVSVNKVGTTVTFTTGTHGVTIGQTRYLLISNYDGDYSPDGYSLGSVNGMWRVVASTTTQFTATITSHANAEFVLNSPVKSVELYSDPSVHFNEIQRDLIINSDNTKIENSRASSFISSVGGHDTDSPAVIKSSSSSNIAFSRKSYSSNNLYIYSSDGSSIISSAESFMNNAMDSNIIGGVLSYITNVSGRGNILASSHSRIDSSNSTTVVGSVSTYIINSSDASSVFGSGYVTINNSDDSSIISSHAPDMSRSISIIDSPESHIFGSSNGSTGNNVYIQEASNSAILNSREFIYVSNTTPFTYSYIGSYIYNSRKSFLQKVDGSYISYGGGNSISNSTVSYIHTSYDSGISDSYGTYIKTCSRSFIIASSSYGFTTSQPITYYPTVRIQDSLNSSIISAREGTYISNSSYANIIASENSYITGGIANNVIGSSYGRIYGNATRSSVISSTTSNINVTGYGVTDSHIVASTGSNIYDNGPTNVSYKAIIVASDGASTHNAILSTVVSSLGSAVRYSDTSNIIAGKDSDILWSNNANIVSSKISYINNSDESYVIGSKFSSIMGQGNPATTPSLYGGNVIFGSFALNSDNPIIIQDSTSASIAFADHASRIYSSSKCKVFGGTYSTINNANTSSIISSFTGYISYTDRSSIVSSNSSSLDGSVVDGFNGIAQCNIAFSNESYFNLTTDAFGYVKASQLSNILSSNNSTIYSSNQCSILSSSGSNITLSYLSNVSESTGTNIYNGLEATIIASDGSSIYGGHQNKVIASGSANIVRYVNTSSIIASYSTSISSKFYIRYSNALNAIASNNSSISDVNVSSIVSSSSCSIKDTFAASSPHIDSIEQSHIFGATSSYINAATHMVIVGGTSNTISSTTESSRLSNYHSGIFVGSYNYINDSDSSVIIGSMRSNIIWSVASAIIASATTDSNSIEYSEASAILASCKSSIKSFNNGLDDYPASWSNATGTFTSGDVVTNTLTITHNLGRNINGWKLFVELTTSDGTVRVVPAPDIIDPTGLGNVIVISNMNIYGAITGIWKWTVVAGGSLFGNYSNTLYRGERGVYAGDNVTLSSMVSCSFYGNIENSTNSSIISTSFGTIRNSLTSVMIGSNNSCYVNDSTGSSMLSSGSSDITSSSLSGIMFGAQCFIRNVIDSSIISSNYSYVVSDSVNNLSSINHDVIIAASQKVGIGTIRTSGVGTSAIIASSGENSYDSNYTDIFFDMTPTTLISDYVENSVISGVYQSYIKTYINASSISSSSYSYIDGGQSTLNRTNTNLVISSSSSSAIRSVGLSASSIHSSVNSYILCEAPNPNFDRSQLTIFGSFNSYIEGNGTDVGMCSIGNSSFSYITDSSRSFILGVNGIFADKSHIYNSYSCHLIGSDDVRIVDGMYSGISGSLSSYLVYTHMGHIFGSNDSYLVDAPFSSILGSDKSFIVDAGRSSVVSSNASNTIYGLRNDLFGTTGSAIVGGYNNIILGGEGNKYGATGSMATSRPTDAIGDVVTTGVVSATLVNKTRSTSYVFTFINFTFGSVTTINIGTHNCQVGDVIEFVGSNSSGLYDNMNYVIKGVVGNVVTVGVDLSIYAQASNAIIGGELNRMISGRHNIIGGGSFNQMTNSVLKTSSTSYSVSGTTLTITLDARYALTEGYSLFNFPSVTLYTIKRRTIDSISISLSSGDGLVDFTPLFTVPATSNSSTSITLDMTSVSGTYPDGTVISGQEIVLSIGFNDSTIAHMYENVILGGYANSTMWDSRRSGVLSGSFNRVYGTDSCLVLGGKHNQISFVNAYTEFLAEGSSILGGQDNTVINSKFSSIIAGYNNVIGNGTHMNVIAGGAYNTIRAASNVSDPATTFYVGGGVNISLQSSEFIGGGVQNTILFAENGLIHSAIIGGANNQIANSDESGIFVSDGSRIGVDSSSYDSRNCFILGGSDNIIGDAGNANYSCIMSVGGSSNKIHSGTSNGIFGTGIEMTGCTGVIAIGSGHTLTNSSCIAIGSGHALTGVGNAIVIGSSITYNASFNGIVTNAIHLVDASNQLKVGGYTYTFPASGATVGDYLKIASISGSNITLEWAT